jgi:hypothetical protein
MLSLNTSCLSNLENFVQNNEKEPEQKKKIYVTF